MVRGTLKFIKILALALVCVLTPKLCDAATAAILPLINSTMDREAGAVYLREAARAVELKPGFTLVKDDRVYKAACQYVSPSRLPNAYELEQIARAAGIDVIISMQLSKMEKTGGSFNFAGTACGYNALSRRSYRRALKVESPKPGSLASRWGWRHAAWGKAVRQEAARVLAGR